MMRRKKIFISYNHKDQKSALSVLARLKTLPGFEVWFDRHSIAPGQRLSDEIEKGLNASNYYVILISENSNKSEWVKRELSAAFDLSRKNGLALVPFVIDDAETPLEFKGQLTINAQGDRFERGLDELTSFLLNQEQHPENMDFGRDASLTPSTPCEVELRRLVPGDLRFLLTKRLSVADIGVIWFDLFNEPIENEVAPTTLAQYCVALIVKTQREQVLGTLYKILCRNHPRLGELAKAR